MEVEGFALALIRLSLPGGTAGFLNFEFTPVAKAESRIEAIEDRQAAAAGTDENF